MYGRDYNGRRFVELDEITPENVDRLHPAWVFATGGENGGLEATSWRAGRAGDAMVRWRHARAREGATP